MSQARWQFWIDRGGTFTDCLGLSPEGELRSLKVLSSDRAPLIGIRKLLGLAENEPIPPSEIKMGTTVATNALLERKGEDHALLITKGFADALAIGTQQRPNLFDLHVTQPSVLYKKVIEVDERISPNGEILTPLPFESLREVLTESKQEGFDNLAILFLHAFAFPKHELEAAELARELGFRSVSCSHEVCPEIGFTVRGDTTTADAYLTPLLASYLSSLKQDLPGSHLQMMQSSGGLTDAESFRGHNSILSGPAAGVVACGRLGEWFGAPKIIGFDMGGTSTDVSRYGGRFERVYETVTAGVRIKAPMLAIHTIAAGGGSICKWVAGRLSVGPESAGADPGPLCYGLAAGEGTRKAEEITVTDVNLYLGRLLPDFFPFPLEKDPVEMAMRKMSDAARKEGFNLSETEIAEGFLEVVNLKMAQAIKEITVARGHDVREYALCCFGGAGGQHACAIARLLGIEKILIHPLAGVLSAYGIGVSDTVWEGSSPVSNLPLTAENLSSLESDFANLEVEGKKRIEVQGFPASRIRTLRKLDLRYVGTETPLTIPEPEDGNYLSAFTEQHRQIYGYVREKRPVEILQCRLEAVGVSEVHPPTAAQDGIDYEPDSERTTQTVFGGKDYATPVYERADLFPGALIEGPALILESIGTVVVEPGFIARVDEFENLVLHPESSEVLAREDYGTEADPIALEVFNNLFMSVAEQMGNTLRRTAVSTNIKERLDFSCAVFDAEGRLAANAPHIPVHLGAMGESVRALLEAVSDMKPGDVYVTNNPYRGGTHLPDITAITPVFIDGVGKIRPSFFVASRAHHADVGGIAPGSVPPFSKSIEEEGILLDNVRLVEGGTFREDLFESLFTEGDRPARNPSDNRADLEAQLAANNIGARVLRELVERYTLETVQAYMGHVRRNAAKQVRRALERLPDGDRVWKDRMDDGTPIQVNVRVEGDRAIVDFAGTGPESESNLNAPRAVTLSAVLYVFRCLVEEAIPLNEGCLDPIEVRIPKGSILDPSPGRAVVGGNVETSQRVVDVLLGALGAAAASQGTMNNLTFGDETFGYYETIAGGVGAAEGYEGASGVHSHMTNTRITDPEILETRHPVRLLEFSLRPGSGGKGKWNGGNGIRRRFRFLSDLDVSLLSERRDTAPFGLLGGKDGKVGENTRITTSGESVELGGKASYRAEAGEELLIETPGGGGYGEES
jgi:5-oxoprolinase (ATP-hydrolysing)